MMKTVYALFKGIVFPHSELRHLEHVLHFFDTKSVRCKNQMFQLMWRLFVFSLSNKPLCSSAQLNEMPAGRLSNSFLVIDCTEA